MILGAVEILVFFALGAYMILTETNSSAPFTPSEGADGWGGIFQGAVFVDPGVHRFRGRLRTR